MTMANGARIADPQIGVLVFGSGLAWLLGVAVGDGVSIVLIELCVGEIVCAVFGIKGIEVCVSHGKL